jgi:hypothetical protein
MSDVTRPLRSPSPVLRRRWHGVRIATAATAVVVAEVSEIMLSQATSRNRDDRGRAAGMVVLDGVGQQVEKDLTQPLPVGPRVRRATCGCGPQVTQHVASAAWCTTVTSIRPTPRSSAARPIRKASLSAVAS